MKCGETTHPLVAHACMTWLVAQAVLGSYPAGADLVASPDLFHMLAGHGCGCGWSKRLLRCDPSLPPARSRSLMPDRPPYWDTEPDPSDLPELGSECGICGAESDLHLGPWRDGDDHYHTITRCRDWRACADRAAARKPASQDEGWL